MSRHSPGQRRIGCRHWEWCPENSNLHLKLNYLSLSSFFLNEHRKEQPPSNTWGKKKKKTTIKSKLKETPSSALFYGAQKGSRILFPGLAITNTKCVALWLPPPHKHAFYEEPAYYICEIWEGKASPDLLYAGALLCFYRYDLSVPFSCLLIIQKMKACLSGYFQSLSYSISEFTSRRQIKYFKKRYFSSQSLFHPETV